MIQAYSARALMGAGGAFAFVGTMRLVKIWFPKNKTGCLSGLTVASAMLGALFGQQVLFTAVTYLGVRITFLVLGCIGVLLMLFILIGVRDAPGQHSIQRASAFSVITDLSLVMRNKENWKVALFAGLIYVPLPAFAGLWASPFLNHLYNIPYQASLQVASLIWLGMAVGSPLLGLASDKLKDQKNFMLFSAFSILILFLCLLSGSLASWKMIGVLFFLIGFFCGAYSLAFSMLHEINPVEVASLSVSFVMTLVMLIATLSTQGIGLALRFAHGISNAAQVKNFTGSDYQTAVFLIPALILISLVIVQRIPSLRCCLEE